MRIIAGKYRGRKLLPPEGLVTRPITDRVKQSLFDILAPMLPEARVYDCFAGTGSMGLECLSREASAVSFFEADRSALVRLKKNIAAIGEERRGKVIAGDLFRWFASHPAIDDPRSAVDLIFLDPPYRFVRENPQRLQELAQHLAAHLGEQGIVVFRHDANDAMELSSLQRYDVREYGGMVLEFLKR
jgi:16S rRNA (guanine966-N2)-methyltransferase